MLTLQGFLRPDELAAIVARLGAEAFVPGVETATGRAAEVKRNLQLPGGSAAERELDALVRAAFERHPGFADVVMPVRSVPMRFARYEAGMGYGWHVDNGLMAAHGGKPMRSDLACTLFLADPGSYGGGELSLQTPVGHLKVKLPAGDAVVYPATMVHRVEPVTHGVRLVGVTWFQSLVASAEQRQLLADLAQATSALLARDPQAPEYEALTAVRHNLMRMWGQP